MSDFLKMDVFFAVTTAAVVVVAALASVALFHLIRLLRAAERISGGIEEEAALVRADIRDLRAGIRAEGFKWKHLSRWWRRLFGGRPQQND